MHEKERETERAREFEGKGEEDGVKDEPHNLNF